MHLWVALCTSATGLISNLDTGATVSATYEVDGNNYERATASDSYWDAADSSMIVTADSVVFSSATGSWGTVDVFCLCDASVAGNLVAFCSVDVAKTVSADDIVKFGVGAISITLS